MAVPEQHHFFLERPRPFGHAIEPPATQFHQAIRLEPLLLLLDFPAFLRRRLLDGIAPIFISLRIGDCPDRVGGGVGYVLVIE